MMYQQTFSNILNARSHISRAMAVRFGAPARQWLMRQRDYEPTKVTHRGNKTKVEPFRPTTTGAAGGSDERRRD
jgi:plasmid maintenance system antidote protein VapI